MHSAPGRTLAEARIPARAAAPRRWVLHGRYLWRNSANPVLRRFRSRWDCTGSALPVIRSELGGISITYAGLADGIGYALEFTELRRAADPGHSPMRSSRTMRAREIERVEQLPDADLVLVGTTAAKARRLPVESSFIMPMRVHFVVDFDADTDTVLARAARGERRNFRQKCRQHDWQLIVERDPAWFDHFYDRSYRATMHQRHGARQRIEGKESAYECLFRSGVLFILQMDGNPIGGHLCHWNPRTRVLTSRLIGVLDGAAEHYAAGAIKVMYFLLIGWAGDHGVRQLDFQSTEPFLSKGTYQLKRLFGTRVVLPPNHLGDKRLWLQVRRDTPAVRDFLVANPFLTVRADATFDAVYFYDHRRPARTDYKANSPGVSRVRQIDLDDFFATGCRVAAPGRVGDESTLDAFGTSTDAPAGEVAGPSMPNPSAAAAPIPVGSSSPDAEAEGA